MADCVPRWIKIADLHLHGTAEQKMLYFYLQSGAYYEMSWSAQRRLETDSTAGLTDCDVTESW